MRGTVHVIGKFRKERDVPMQPDARAALEEQLEEEGKLWKQNPQRLREVLAEGSARAKIPSITPHVLRHTFGTRWLQAGGDIYKLSKILGHSSVAVTEAHYAHLLKEDLVAASQQVKIPVAPRGNGHVVRMPGVAAGPFDGRFLRQEVLRVVAAGCRKSTVKGDHTATMSSREPEKVTVRDLLRGRRGPHFGHRCRRYGIRPELVVAACSSEQQESIGGCFGWPRPTGQLRADANHSKLGDSAGRPALITFRREPLDRGVVMLMLRNKQRNQHVDVQKADHGQDYSPAPSARRSTSSTDSVGAPGRRGNAGTPRSNRTSAFAIRLRSASTNSSTRCPDWLARSASRSFNAASTVIVAFGITSLSHDVVKSANRRRPARRAASQRVAARVVPNLVTAFLRRCKSLGNQCF